MENKKLDTDSKKREARHEIKVIHPQEEIMRKIDDEINRRCPKDILKGDFINNSIKIAPSTYYKYLNCSSKLSLDQLQTMVSFLGLSYDDLFDNVGQRTEKTETTPLKDKFADIVKAEGQHTYTESNLIAEQLVLNYNGINKILNFKKHKM